VTATRARGVGTRGSLDDYALVPYGPGMPWWAAVLCAFALAATGVFADLERVNRLSMVFEVCYFLGCVFAVVVVQRKGLFAPMVAPPLILAVTVPGVVLATGSTPTGGGFVAAALAVGTPLINGFPTMAITTVVTVTIGFLRWCVQRRPSARHTTE
jgi:hypothetical protein